MKQRCFNPNNKDYRLYGARGISVCDKWRKSFELFLEDVGRRPSPSHSLDRRENNGNYEPGNVRWATPTEQVRNSRRKICYFSFKGLKLTTKELANRPEIKKLGISHLTLRNRLKNYGWSVVRATTTPVLPPEFSEECHRAWSDKSKKLTFNGFTATITQWAKRLGCSRDAIVWRIKKGWSVRRILTEKASPNRYHRKSISLPVRRAFQKFTEEFDL